MPQVALFEDDMPTILPLSADAPRDEGPLFFGDGDPVGSSVGCAPDDYDACMQLPQLAGDPGSLLIFLLYDVVVDKLAVPNASLWLRGHGFRGPVVAKALLGGVPTDMTIALVNSLPARLAAVDQSTVQRLSF